MLRAYIFKWYKVFRQKTVNSLAVHTADQNDSKLTENGQRHFLTNF